MSARSTGGESKEGLSDDEGDAEDVDDDDEYDDYTDEDEDEEDGGGYEREDFEAEPPLESPMPNKKNRPPRGGAGFD